MSSQPFDRLREDVTLGELEEAHAPTMYRWMCDPAVSRPLVLRHKPSMDRTLGWLDRVKNDSSIRAWAVLLGGHHVGNVVLDRIDTYFGTTRASAYIGEATARGLGGVGSSGMFLAFAAAFDQLNLNKVWGVAQLDNHRSIAALIRLGFCLEGILREEFILDGQRLPGVYLGLLRSDFDRLPLRIARQRAAS